MAHKVPPLNALRVFEVAARAGSYSAAAHELNLTHGAVSRQIALLERWLGQHLFVRQGNRMVASEHARAFAAEVSAAFDHLSDASQRYGKRAANRVIRVNAPATFAMRWLIPRLSLFTEALPHIDVRISTAFSTEPTLKGSFDVVIRRDAVKRDYFEATPIFSEWSTVIASPKLLRDEHIVNVEALASQIFLTTDTRPGDWENWLKAAGHPELRPRHFLRFDHFFVTLQAVVDDMGVGIGTFPTLDGDKAAGRIELPFADTRVMGSTYFVLVPLDADKPVHLRQFVEWLVDQGESTP